MRAGRPKGCNTRCRLKPRGERVTRRDATLSAAWCRGGSPEGRSTQQRHPRHERTPAGEVTTKPVRREGHPKGCNTRRGLRLLGFSRDPCWRKGDASTGWAEHQRSGLANAAARYQEPGQTARWTRGSPEGMQRHRTNPGGSPKRCNDPVAELALCASFGAAGRSEPDGRAVANLGRASRRPQ